MLPIELSTAIIGMTGRVLSDSEWRKLDATVAIENKFYDRLADTPAFLVSDRKTKP